TPPSTEREPEPDTERFVPNTRTQPLDPIYLPKTTSSPPVFEGSSPLPAPTGPVLRTMNLGDDPHDPHGEYSDNMRGRSPSLSDAPSSMGKRRSVGGFIIAFVVLAG